MDVALSLWRGDPAACAGDAAEVDAVLARNLAVRLGLAGTEEVAKAPCLCTASRMDFRCLGAPPCSDERPDTRQPVGQMYLYLFRLPHSFRNGFTQPPLPGPWLETLPPLVLGANWTGFRGAAAGAALLRWPGAGVPRCAARAPAAGPAPRAPRGVSASPDVSGARSAVGSPECGELL